MLGSAHDSAHRRRKLTAHCSLLQGMTDCLWAQYLQLQGASLPIANLGMKREMSKTHVEHISCALQQGTCC